MEINSGVEDMILAFEDGWRAGAAGIGECPPTLSAGLRDYWQDGFLAARTAAPQQTAATLQLVAER